MMFMMTDFNRKFLEASRKFYELSHKVIESEQLQMLNSAIVCALLADAGLFFFSQNIVKI